ncbi:MAG: oligopeptide transport system permease protein [Rhodospirillaceae bacterium]|jgi:oligopeptide transport system permease protein|nr:oligopeptide transport system permease protein [Rhodospirillaceae bacterium]
MTQLAQAPAVLPGEEVKGRSLWVDAWRRLLRNRAAVVSAILLALISLACVLAPLLSPIAYDEVFWDSINTPPDFAAGHYFGTDDNGRDLFVRTMYGGRVSLTVGLVATLVSLVIGVAWGATAGFLEGRVDAIMMRIVDILYSIPFIFFVIMLTVVFGRNITLIYIAIGAVTWLDMARIVRGQTMSLKRREFVEAARAGGVRTSTIIFRHIIPNCLGPVVVYVTLTVPNVILLESFLSFLGLGVQEPSTSWGVLISDGARTMESSPWALCFPAAMLAVTLGCFNFIGDGLRDALDPKDR